MDGGPLGTANETSDTPLAVAADVNGVWLRFVFTMSMFAAGLGGAVLDLKVRLDRK